MNSVYVGFLDKQTVFQMIIDAEGLDWAISSVLPLIMGGMSEDEAMETVWDRVSLHEDYEGDEAYEGDLPAWRRRQLVKGVIRRVIDKAEQRDWEMRVSQGPDEEEDDFAF
jgi:hypothetical protein